MAFPFFYGSFYLNTDHRDMQGEIRSEGSQIDSIRS